MKKEVIPELVLLMVQPSINGTYMGNPNMKFFLLYKKMVMPATAYKASDMTGSHIATTLACGFTGQLKSWWDYFLTMQQKLDILNHSYKIGHEKIVPKSLKTVVMFLSLQFPIILLVAPQNTKVPQNQSLLTYNVLL